MIEDQTNQNLQSSIPPWKLPSQVVEPIATEQVGKKKTSRKLLLVFALLVSILIVLGIGLGTGYLNTDKINQIVPFAQEKHETRTFEVSLPKDWDVSVEGSKLTASQSGNKIRQITISPNTYDETLISRYCKPLNSKDIPYSAKNDEFNHDNWIKYCNTTSPNPPVKENHVYRARWLTSECGIDKEIGENCDRTYYLWNIDQRMMAKLYIRWEKWSLEEIAKDENSFRKAQSEGLPKAHPSIENMEKQIFNTFKFIN